MKKLNIQFLAGCFIFIVVLSCDKKKFETRGWAVKGDANFPSPDREKMLDDLLSDYKLVGMKYSELIKLLGSPDNGDSVSISYQIELDYGFGIDPVIPKIYIFSSQMIQ